MSPFMNCFGRASLSDIFDSWSQSGLILGVIRASDRTPVDTEPNSSRYQPWNVWVDTTPFKDVAFFLEVADYLNVILILQTSPSLDEPLFQNLSPYLSPAAIGVTTGVFRSASADPPVARYIRWYASAQAAGAWRLTFRLWLSLNYGSVARRATTAAHAARLHRAHQATHAHPAMAATPPARQSATMVAKTKGTPQ